MSARPGKTATRLLYAGVFPGGARSPEFGDFDGSAFAILRAERDFGERLEIDEAVLGIHAVFQDPDPDNTFTRPNQRVFSLNFRGREGPWHLQGDLARSAGYDGQPDLTGLVVMPAFDIDESWQLVARATAIASEGPGGVRAGRYESRIDADRGDRFAEIYLGVNRYFNGHKLKWQAGVSRFELENLAGGGDHQGWNFSSGIRISW